MDVDKHQRWKREALLKAQDDLWAERYIDMYEELWEAYVTQKLSSMEAEAGFNDFILEMARRAVEDNREACFRAWSAGYDARGTELGRGVGAKNPYGEKIDDEKS